MSQQEIMAITNKYFWLILRVIAFMKKIRLKINCKN